MKSPEGTQTLFDSISTAFFEMWLWVTIGLIAVVAFFGKRLLTRWDYIIDSHMPDHEIEEKLNSIRNDMEDSQKALSDEQKSNHNSLLKGIGEVHTRLDNLYELLLQRRK